MSPSRRNTNTGRFLKTVVFVLTGTLLFALSVNSGSVAAQEESPGAVYRVQEGDSLWTIAARFGVRVQELQAANGITDGNQITEGMALIIPGLEGVQGELTTEPAAVGETLFSMSKRYDIPVNMLARLNHITSPAELYIGRSMILPVNENGSPAARLSVSTGNSLLEISAAGGVSPWYLSRRNGLAGPSSAIPGDVLFGNTEEIAKNGPGTLPSPVSSLFLTPTIPMQGGTVALRVEAPQGTEISGTLASHDLQFFALDGGFAALQGLHAMLEPGLYPLTLALTFAEDESFEISQSLYVGDGGYPFDPVLTVSAETLDPAVTEPENAQWNALASTYSEEKRWEGLFQAPVADAYADCFPSRFGNRRSYNGSAYSFFHTGLDFCGGVGNEIYAPADGVVVFAGPLTVRGIATMIDHGWGVFTGYMHQSEVLVKAGDLVEAGDLIGKVGATGRVTGPHLHWEVFVGGVQVDPLAWLARRMP